MVHFKNVSKTYSKGIQAVKDVSFLIDPGEFVFLIGPSGSGKTTVIKMLIRDEVPTEGNIFFDDKDITRVSRRNIYKLRREVGVIFQDYKLVPEKTAYENVAFAMEAAGKSNKEIKEAVPYVLDIVGLENRMEAFPKELSGGEQQRVAIARAMANNPKILIADEPTGNLDPASSWDIVQVLTKINSWGTTVIMSTHGTEIVNSLNKRVIQMHNGSVIRDDNEGQYEMTSVFEENMMKASEVDTEDKPDFFEKKHKKLKLKKKGEGGKGGKEGKEGKESESVSTETLSEDGSEVTELKITLGHKGVKIPVRKAKAKANVQGTMKNDDKKGEKSEESEESEESKISHRQDSRQSVGQAGGEGKKSKSNKIKSAEVSKDKKERALTSSEIFELELSGKLTKTLSTNGYKSVQDLIDAGPEKLKEIESMKDKDLKKITQAIEAFQS